MPTTEERFWAKVDRRGDDECWPWQAFLRPDGYGHFWIPALQRMSGSHRVAYELLVGPIPEGLVIDHLCRNHACCNPGHMEAVTNEENIRRGIPRCAKKTHCLRGHPLSGDNLHISPRGQRVCRTCKRLSMRELRASKFVIATEHRGH